MLILLETPRQTLAFEICENPRDNGIKSAKESDGY